MAEKRRNEEDVKKRREEEVKRSREVMPRSCKLSKVTSSTTSEEEESNGGRACAPISRKFLNLFAKNDSQNSATGVYFQTFFSHTSIRAIAKRFAVFPRIVRRRLQKTSSYFRGRSLTHQKDWSSKSNDMLQYCCSIDKYFGLI